MPNRICQPLKACLHETQTHAGCCCHATCFIIVHIFHSMPPRSLIPVVCKTGSYKVSSVLDETAPWSQFNRRVSNQIKFQSNYCTLLVHLNASEPDDFETKKCRWRYVDCHSAQNHLRLWLPHMLTSCSCVMHIQFCHCHTTSIQSVKSFT